MKRYVIIVAGGQGIRMQGALPKQFLSLNGIPVLMHTIAAFQHPNMEVILVMSKDYIRYWEELCSSYNFKIDYRIVSGGKSRAESVKNGLEVINEEGLVAIHDAVRPFVSSDMIERLYCEAEAHDSAIPVIDVKDTLREVNGNGESITVPRSSYRAVQTPQVFKVSKLKTAFAKTDFANFTDEASLYESTGNKVFLVEGEESNFKITVPFDLVIAEVLLKSKKS